MGTAGDDVLTGTAADEVLIGGLGDDTLNGAGGIDVLTGAGGNDFLVFDPNDRVVDGGSGEDTLQFTGTGGSLDLTATIDTKYTGIEIVDLTGTGNNTLTLAFGDLLDLSDSTNTLRVDGANKALDLTTISNAKITNVEIINLTGSGNNTLTLNLADVLALSSTTNTLRVDGNAGDIVHRGAGWTPGADQVIGAQTYDTFTQGTAILLVDTDVGIFI